MKTVADRVVDLRSDLQKWKTSQFIGSSSSYVYSLVKNGRYQFNLQGEWLSYVIAIKFLSSNQVAPMISGKFRLYVNGVDRTNALRIMYPSSNERSHSEFLETSEKGANIWLEVDTNIWYPESSGQGIFEYDLYGTSQGKVTVTWLAYSDVPL